MDRKKITITDLQEKKSSRKKITMLTAYDYPVARLADEAGLDAILVGDTLGMVVLGYESTVPVTMEEMIHHAKAVRRGVRYGFMIVDMPFLSYQVSEEDAVRNAGRLMKETGCDAVKLEGGTEVITKTKAIIDAGIPVLGHLGLTPQSASKLGGYRVQGKDAASARAISDQALELERAGCFGVVLECMPREAAAYVTERLRMITISCGAGPSCDGQVIVTYDMIGMFDKFTPKFAKTYARTGKVMLDAFTQYRDEVERGVFPGEEHCFHMKDDQVRLLNKEGRKTGSAKRS